MGKSNSGAITADTAVSFSAPAQQKRKFKNWAFTW